MSDTLALPPPDAPEPAPPPRAPRPVVPWLVGAVGFLILAVAVILLWQRPAGVDQGLQDRVARLEQGRAEELGRLTTRLDALEKRQQPDLAPLANRLTALEQRPLVDPGEGARMDALSGRIEVLAGRLQTGDADLAKRLDAVEQRFNTGDTDLTRRLDGLEARLAQLEKASGQVTAVAERAGKLARIQAASSALAAGQKLGGMPGAPPALARFADTNPPTEAGLRMSYPKAEKAALAASRPDDADLPFLNRVLARTEALVTIRQGDHVVIGDAAAGVLARTRAALEAGDLSGAVDAASSLTGPPAEAMAPWLNDARALLDARRALADMAEHA